MDRSALRGGKGGVRSTPEVNGDLSTLIGWQTAAFVKGHASLEWVFVGAVALCVDCDGNFEVRRGFKNQRRLGI